MNCILHGIIEFFMKKNRPLLYIFAFLWNMKLSTLLLLNYYQNFCYFSAAFLLFVETHLKC